MAPIGLILGLVAGGLEIYSGLLGFSGSEAESEINSSRARMVRVESEIEARRHKESAESFRARQKTLFIKSGVEISGSPIDILDETTRIAAEDISAIRARGRARALDIEAPTGPGVAQGRAALIGGFGRGAVRIIGALGSIPRAAPRTA